MATKLKMMIVEKDLKQGDLVRLIGVSDYTIRVLATGKAKPTIEVAIKIARALETTAEELWGTLWSDTHVRVNFTIGD